MTRLAEPIAHVGSRTSSSIDRVGSGSIRPGTALTTRSTSFGWTARKVYAMRAWSSVAADLVGTASCGFKAFQTR